MSTTDFHCAFITGNTRGDLCVVVNKNNYPVGFVGDASKTTERDVKGLFIAKTVKMSVITCIHCLRRNIFSVHSSCQFKHYN